MELLLVALLVSNNPYAWEMSCERWHDGAKEILMDEYLPAWEKDRLIRYFRSKVVEPCPDLTISVDPNERRSNSRSARAERNRLLQPAALRLGS